MGGSKKITRRETLLASIGALGLAAGGTAARAETAQRDKLAGKQVLVCIGEFSEGMETYYMIYRLMEEGILPIVAAPVVKRLQTVCHDFDPAYLGYTEKLAYYIKSQIDFKNVDPSAYDGLLLPGGRAPEEIRQNGDLIRVVNDFLQKGKPIGAMCHGVQILYTNSPVQGRKMTAYYGIRADMLHVGIQFIDAPVVVDGALVTSRGWPDLPYFMPQFLEVLARQ